MISCLSTLLLGVLNNLCYRSICNFRRTYGSIFYCFICRHLTTFNVKELLKQDKVTMDLEYELICDFIKLRHKLGLTQQQMADEAGVIRELIAILETRRKALQITTLIKLLKPFGYTIGKKNIWG